MEFCCAGVISFDPVISNLRIRKLVVCCGLPLEQEADHSHMKHDFRQFCFSLLPLSFFSNFVISLEKHENL